MSEGVREFFGRHAEGYAASESHRQGADLGLLMDALAVKEGERALDVATGTGFTAMALAERGATVTALDLTEPMLATARRLAADRGIEGIRWVEGDAARLPFADRSFDIVTSRRAAHHFPDVGRALAEWARVLVSSGRVGVADMCPPAAGAALLDTLERIRDSSHVSALTEERWRAALREQGFTVRSLVIEKEVRTLAQWFYPVPMAEKAVEAVRRALAQAPAAALRALRVEGTGEDVRLLKRRAVIVATR